jgi:hypothetical protein
MKAFVAAFFTLFALIIIGTLVVMKIQFNQNCTGFLKRAADANTVETAKAQLDKSIDYLDLHNMTTGYTSVLWQTPDEDIEFWFNNLKSASAELAKVDSTTTSLEKTNILMKLRETLLDAGEKGEKLTVPDGLYKYPDNKFWVFMSICAGIILIGGIISILIWIDNN